MSNARRLHRDRKPSFPADTTPPRGRVRRLWWRCRRWLGIH